MVGDVTVDNEEKCQGLAANFTPTQVFTPASAKNAFVQIDPTKLCVANTLASNDAIALLDSDISGPATEGSTGQMEACTAGGGAYVAVSGEVAGVTYCSCYTPPDNCEECDESSSYVIYASRLSLLTILVSLWN